MNESEVLMVRIYSHEAGTRMKELLEFLHDESKVRGVTIFRGITGFGNSGQYHSSTLMDTALDLPIVIEFYDEPDKARSIIENLGSMVKPGHIAWWPAKINA